MTPFAAKPAAAVAAAITAATIAAAAVAQSAASLATAAVAQPAAAVSIAAAAVATATLAATVAASLAAAAKPGNFTTKPSLIQDKGTMPFLPEEVQEIIRDYVRESMRPALKRRLFALVHVQICYVTIMPYWQRHLLNDRHYPHYL